MKIHNQTNLDKLNPTQQESSVLKRKEAKADEVQSGAEKTRLSALSQQIARAKEAADQLPSVRADRVALARERLASGYYDSPEAKEALVSRLAELISKTSL